MLYYRNQLYTGVLPKDIDYRGEIIPLSMIPKLGSDDDVAFYRGIDTTLPTGVELFNGFDAVFPPPIMKTVEILGHSRYPMGVVAEVLYHHSEHNEWVPYYARVYMDTRAPVCFLHRPGVDYLHSKQLGVTFQDSVVSTVEKGLWTCCGMPGNEDAHEGLSYFFQAVPYMGHLVKPWSNERDMVNTINRSVEGLAKIRDRLNATEIEAITYSLFCPISDIPNIFRTPSPIFNRHVSTDRVNWFPGYNGDPSPALVAQVTPTDRYSHRYRDVFYALVNLPITDMEVWCTIKSDGRIVHLDPRCIVNRHIPLIGERLPWTVMEGHIRYLCEKLANGILNHNASFSNAPMSLHEVYGSHSLTFCFIKTYEEIMQIRIYDSGGTMVFAMIIPTAVVHLTDTSIMAEIPVR